MACLGATSRCRALHNVSQRVLLKFFYPVFDTESCSSGILTHISFLLAAFFIVSCHWVVQWHLPTVLKQVHKNTVSTEIVCINIKMMQWHCLGRRITPWLQEIQILIIRKTWKSFKLLWTSWLPSLLEHPLFFLLFDLLRSLPPLASRWLLDLVRWLLLIQRCIFKISNWFAWLTEIFLPPSWLYTTSVIRHPLLLSDSYNDRCPAKNHWCCVWWSTENQVMGTTVLQNNRHVMNWAKEDLFEFIVLASVGFLNVLSIFSSHLALKRPQAASFLY